MPPPQGDLENDAHLAAAAATGDGAAFATLYGRYEPRVYNICLRITGDPEDAADATQEAFLSVLRRLREGERPVRSFPAYLFTSARHAAANVCERRTRACPSASARCSPCASLESSAMTRSPRRWISTATPSPSSSGGRGSGSGMPCARAPSPRLWRPRRT